MKVKLINCQATGTGTWDLGPGTRDLGPGIRDLGPGTWHMGHGTWYLVPGNIESTQAQEMTVKSHGPPATPQLLTMKEHSDNKVPLVRMSQDDPLNPSSTKNYQRLQVDSENNNMG